MKMESPLKASNNVEVTNRSLQLVKYSASGECNKLLSPCFDIRVFYVRLCGFQVDEATPKFLTLNHIPLSHDTLLEVNGVRSSMYLDGVSSLLTRDRVDKKSDEATFVNTDSICLTGSVKFEVYDKEDCVLSGILEFSNNNSIIGESKSNAKRWSMSCETKITTHDGFFKGKHVTISELSFPRIEVYVAGCFSRTPVILTKTLQLSFRKKYHRKCKLNAIPEYESAECQKDVSDGLYLQVADHRSFKPEHEEDYKSMYWQRTGYIDIDGEYGELSWYNAGVRVGVGIGLGICVGVGLGAGLLFRSYQATTRNFKRRFM